MVFFALLALYDVTESGYHTYGGQSEGKGVAK